MSIIIQEISEKKPTGKDYKYEDGYIAIESEIDKTMSASSAGEVDWKFIQESSEEILAKSSKDLKIASYWLYSQWKLSSWVGLENSLPIYSELLKTYELKLFPKSQKVKLRILEWLHESLTVAILQNISSLETDKLKVLINNIVYLEASVLTMLNQEELTVFSPLIRKLNKVFEERKLDIEEVIEPEEVNEEEVDDLVIEEISSYSIERHKKKIEEELSSTKEDYFLFDLSLSLGIHRLSALINEKKKIEREQFPSDEELNELSSTEDKEILLEKSKSLLTLYPCWLEGYYLILKNSNVKKIEEHNKIILNTLKYNLITFLNNNGKKLHNHQPSKYSIVGDEVKKWVNLEKKLLIFNNKNGDFEEKYQEAKQLVSVNKKEEAILLIDQLRKNSKSSEESFLWGLKQVDLAMEMGNRNMVIALLYGLDGEIEAYNIAQWKPELAIKVYVLFLKPSITKILNSETKELFYGKLCRLSLKDANSVSFL